jgi:hypothetical protein
MSGKTYLIWTVGDILQVPPERRASMFKELELALLAHELTFGDMAKKAFRDAPMRWTDDGEKSVKITDRNGNGILHLSVTKVGTAGEGER